MLMHNGKEIIFLLICVLTDPGRKRVGIYVSDKNGYSSKAIKLIYYLCTSVHTWIFIDQNHPMVEDKNDILKKVYACVVS